MQETVGVCSRRQGRRQAYTGVSWVPAQLRWWHGGETTRSACRKQGGCVAAAGRADTPQGACRHRADQHMAVPAVGVLQVIRKTPDEIEPGISPQHEAQLIAVATDLCE
jgi:hypothetical protein